MSKLGKELKKNNVALVLDSDGRRMKCDYCRSKALELKDGKIVCYSCGHELKREP